MLCPHGQARIRGDPRAAVLADLEAHPEVATSFDALIGPAGHGVPDASFEIAGGWETVCSVVDVGAGTGAMVAEILQRRPAVHGTPVHLPRAAALSSCLIGGRLVRTISLCGRRADHA